MKYFYLYKYKEKISQGDISIWNYQAWKFPTVNFQLFSNYGITWKTRATKCRLLKHSYLWSLTKPINVPVAYHCKLSALAVYQWCSFWKVQLSSTAKFTSVIWFSRAAALLQVQNQNTLIEQSFTWITLHRSILMKI